MEDIVKDPVEDQEKVKEELRQEQDEVILDIDQLSPEAFAPTPQAAARTPHPFEGYPQPKVKVRIIHKDGNGREIETEKTLSLSHLVFLNPGFSVRQDPSGKNLTRVDQIKKENKQTGKLEVVDEKTVKYNLETYHNVVVRDWENGGEDNIDVVFDRIVRLKDGREFRAAIVPGHSLRAQIVFKTDKKTGRTLANDNYGVPDKGQISRLRRIYEMIFNQANKAEILAQEFDIEPESKAP